MPSQTSVRAPPPLTHKAFMSQTIISNEMSSGGTVVGNYTLVNLCMG
jgi:hypothetical protein